MADNKSALLCSGIGIGGVVALGLLLTVTLVPLSLGYLDFYEYAFTRSKISGSVDTSYVYAGGRHFIGLTTEFKEFYAAAQFVKYNHIPIFTTDNLEVIISVEFQYFLIKEDLKLLHDSYDIRYQSIIVNNAKDALKNSITKFDTDEFITNRTVIQDHLLMGLRQRLSGTCCIPGCRPKKECIDCQRWEICDDNCKSREQCSKADKGLFVEVRYLQLHDIDIPKQVNERKLLSLIRELEEEKEQSVKLEMIVKKQTELEVAEIKNNAKELLAKARAEQERTVAEAEVNYQRKIEDVHNIGLQKTFKDLGFTSTKHKAALNYLKSLRDNEKVKYSIDFNTLVTQSR
jgi:regulator of protease activity HflC (stomatin/prohibitin superfamily)